MVTGTPGLGSLLESFIGRLAAQSSMGSVVVVEVLPLADFVVEDLVVVDHDAVQEAVELLGVDAMRALDLAVEPGRSWLDVDMASIDS
jgi:phosphoglucomutase